MVLKYLYLVITILVQSEQSPVLALGQVPRNPCWLGSPNNMSISQYFENKYTILVYDTWVIALTLRNILVYIPSLNILLRCKIWSGIAVHGMFFGMFGPSWHPHMWWMVLYPYIPFSVCEFRRSQVYLRVLIYISLISNNLGHLLGFIFHKLFLSFTHFPIQIFCLLCWLSGIP